MPLLPRGSLGACGIHLGRELRGLLLTFLCGADGSVMIWDNDIQPIQNGTPCLESLVPLLDLLLVVSGVLAEVLDVVARQPVALPALRRHTAIA